METIILKRFDSPVEANIVKGMLESNGIFCFLQDEHSIGLNPLYAIALGGIKLRVRADDEEYAQMILQANSFKPGVQCPYCGSQDVHAISQQKNKVSRLSLFLSLFWTIPLYVKKKYECAICRNVFEAELKE